MKLLFYINTLGGGGAERVIVNLSNYFSRNSTNEVVLVASYPNENEYFIDSTVKKVYLSEERNEDSFLKRNFCCIRELRRIIKAEKPDTALAFMAEPNFRLLLSTFGLSLRKIISVRNDPIREYGNFVYRILSKFLFKYSDLVVFQTQEAKQFFSKKIQKKSAIIMNQVNEKFFATDIVNKRKEIVTVGSFKAQKNHKMLIEAFSKISDKITDNLIIYGEGKLREELEGLIEEKGLTERVFLPGHTSDVIGSIKGAKVFVLSSDYEGMPNALLEAMALGVPCVSTDCPCGGPREIINDAENGFLVPVSDEDFLAKKMLELINNEELQNKFSRNARKSAEKFKPDKIFCEWEKVLLNN
ncbi:MAG: glycosyltransferase family 4 protein [Ruminococcaceae bacterium]|nr:glycosyltransferase family 4 protein [Oscillospiraceae bacterium]